jgi:hypothetical protein
MAGGLTIRLHRWPRPDFAAAARPAVRWPRWLFGAAALTAALCAWQAWGLRAERGQWQARADTANERVLQLRRNARPVGTVANPADTPRAREAAVALVRDLDHAWPSVLGAIERATPRGVRWLAMTHDARRGELRLDGMADSDREAFQFVGALASDAAWHDVALTQLGSATRAAPDGGATRFVVSGRRAVAAVSP